MSKFLAPIHYWLYGKVSIMEDIEQRIINQLSTLDIDSTVKSLNTEFGSPLGDTPLESVIDQGNIHGWLQSKIAAVETRQAKLLDFATTKLPKEQVLTMAKESYAHEGTELGLYRNDNKLESAPELFKALHDVLLEGMPCDRVAVVTESSQDVHNWDVVACVHEAYWNQNEISATDYYQLRAAFSKAFIEGANPDFSYVFNFQNGQKHKICKK